MIIRTSLIDRVLGAPGMHWVFEAGAGFGKTVLIEQVRSALVDSLLVVRGPVAETDLAAFLLAASDAAHRIGRPALAEPIAAAETARDAVAPLIEQRCSVAVDDLHRWDAEVASFVLHMSEETEHLDSVTSVYVLTRRLPTVMKAVRTRPTWSLLGADDLVFGAAQVSEELARLEIEDGDLGPVLHECTGGWPIAVASAAARMRHSEDPADLLRQLSQHNSVIEGLLHEPLVQLEPDDLAAASSLALLPFFDDRIAAMVGSPGLLDRLAGAGLPITRQADGWSTIAAIFRDPLVEASTPTFHEAIVDYLVSRGEIHAAINVCVSMGQNPKAAGIVAGLDYEQAARLDPSALNAAMISIGDAANAFPRALLLQAQLNAAVSPLEHAVTTMEKAAELLAASDPDLKDPVHLELLLELGLWRIYLGQEAEAEAILAQCEAAVPADDHGANRARLLDLAGMVSQSEGTEAGLEQAHGQLVQALEIWRRLQDPPSATITAFRLSSSILFRLGRRQEALDLLDSLPSVGRMTLVNKARLGLERAVVMPYVGRASEVTATLEETRQIATLLGNQTIIAWSSWAEIVAASFENDGDRVLRLVTEYEDENYDLMSVVTQGGMWAETAQALTRCGRLDKAADCLARAAQATGLPPQFLAYAEIYLAAHADPPEVALKQVQAFAAGGTAEVEKRWTLPLLEGLCQARMGNAAEAATLLEAAQRAAAAMGAPSLPMFAERAIVEQIREGGAAPDTMVQLADSAVQITVYDSFGVIVDGQPAAVPGGMVSTLLKVLSVQGGRAVIDQLIDPMWPDADLELGRRRLRNVMRRVRQSCGDIVQRSGESIHLTDDVDVDLIRAVAAADSVSDGETTIDAVAAAIRLNDRPLLPDDRYEEWAEDARREQQQRLVRLLDLQADLAEKAGNVDLAVQSLEAAHVHSPSDEARVRHACDLLRSVERAAAAGALAERYSLA